MKAGSERIKWEKKMREENEEKSMREENEEKYIREENEIRKWEKKMRGKWREVDETLFLMETAPH